MYHVSQKVVGCSFFRDKVSSVSNKARIPSRRDLLTTMAIVKSNLLAKLQTLLKGEYVSITTNGWTFCSNDMYNSLTISLMTKR